MPTLRSSCPPLVAPGALTLLLAAAACTPPAPPGCPAGSAIAPDASAPPASELDLGMAVGMRVATGSTLGAGNDARTPCGGSNAEDRVYAWTAPDDGTYVIDTVGSNYDTLLWVVDRCSGRTVACNDDFMSNGTSRVVVALRAGQLVLIDVDGFGQAAGTYVLNIVHTTGGDGGGTDTDAATDARLDATPEGGGDGGTDALASGDVVMDADAGALVDVAVSDLGAPDAGE